MLAMLGILLSFVPQRSCRKDGLHWRRRGREGPGHHRITGYISFNNHNGVGRRGILHRSTVAHGQIVVKRLQPPAPVSFGNALLTKSATCKQRGQPACRLQELHYSGSLLALPDRRSDRGLGCFRRECGVASTCIQRAATRTERTWGAKRTCKRITIVCWGSALEQTPLQSRRRTTSSVRRTRMSRSAAYQAQAASRVPIPQPNIHAPLPIDYFYTQQRSITLMWQTH